MILTKLNSNQQRWLTAAKDKALAPLLPRLIIDTPTELLLLVLRAGKVSTNVYLRRLHNFCADMSWLPWPLIPKRQWPAVQFKEKRATTLEEHQQIIATEMNPERKALYQLCWHLGASQGDVASLKGEDVDWTNRTVSFTRKKTGVPVIVHLGMEALNLFKDLPGEGPLFPYLSTVRAGDRATEFGQRCRQLGIKGVTLHSYRYAWAERAKVCGYPERFAQEALGHDRKAMHRAYAEPGLDETPILAGIRGTRRDKIRYDCPNDSRLSDGGLEQPAKNSAMRMGLMWRANLIWITCDFICLIADCLCADG